MKKIIFFMTALLVLVISTNIIKNDTETYKLEQNINKNKLSIYKTLNKDKLEAFRVANKSLISIKNYDYRTLSNYIHPEKGVTFVFATTINYAGVKSPTFLPDQVRDFDVDDSIYIWGANVYNNGVLEMTVDEYFKKYVYDNNYVSSKKIAINEVIRTSNAIENVMEIFPNSIFIEYYHEGSEMYGYLDWTSLKIVLEKYNNEFKVVAIIHSSYRN